MARASTKIIAIYALLFCAPAFTDTRPDSHGPIGVMAEHAHAKGEYMFSYRYMNMSMDGNYSGSDELSTSEVLIGGTNTGEYNVAPLDMDMQMHMFGLMYAPSNNTTLMLMVPMIDLSMNHQISPMSMANPNQTFKTESDGIGDTKLAAIIRLGEETNGSQLLLNVGISIPTGSIDEEGVIAATPSAAEQQLPFPMQIGSGTYDFLPGVTYTQMKQDTSWGAQAAVVIRTGRNDNGYSLGNRLKLNAWHAWVVKDNVSLSARAQFESWDNIDGTDREQALPISMPMPAMPMMTMMTMRTVPTVDPHLRAGQRLDIAAGINSVWGEKDHRVAAEIVNPVHQYLDGPQLGNDISLVLGYQLAF